MNTEGLLLLTNDGGLARVLELPATAWLRRYRVRALGRVTQETLDGLRKGVTVEGVHYGPIEATLERQLESNCWLSLGIREGKNREVRKVMESLGLKVSRLIRVAYGPFELGPIAECAVKEVETADLRKTLGPQIVAQANADFDAPLGDDEVRKPLRGKPERGKSEHGKPERGREGVPRHSGARPPGREPGIQKHGRNARPDSGSPLRGARNDKEKWQGRAPQAEAEKPRAQPKKRRRFDRSGGPRPSRPRPK
jgi:23S rRNA pseudouridine2605 synthase